MIRIDKCLAKDIGYVTNLEIATQEYPLSFDTLKCYALENNRDAFLARVTNKVVGYMLVDFHPDNGYSVLKSIGVHRDFRNVKIGTKLVDYAAAESKRVGINKLVTYIASYLIEDKEDPWNIEGWLWKTGFKAGTVLHNSVWRYGRDYDVYVFERLK